MTCDSCTLTPYIRIPLDFAWQRRHHRKSSLQFETATPCALVVKGHVEEYIKMLGFDSKRVFTTSLSLRDPVASFVEPRAVTIVNLAREESEWFNKFASEDDFQVNAATKIMVMFELHKCDATQEDWDAFGNKTAFMNSTDETLTSALIRQEAVGYEPFVKDDYLARKVLIPARAKRMVTDAPEQGLEVTKIPRRLLWQRLELSSQTSPDSWASFPTRSSCSFVSRTITSLR